MKRYFKLWCVLCVMCCVVACDDIIEVEDISNREVVVLAPSNHVVLSVSDVLFTWSPLEDVETYHLQITTPSFESAQQIVKDTTLTTTSFSTTLSFKDYQWRVRAENSGYQTNYTTNSFSIEE